MKIKMEVYKNILDRQKKMRTINNSRVNRNPHYHNNSMISLSGRNEDSFLSSLAKKKYMKNDYSNCGASPSQFFTSPQPQSVSKKSLNYNRFNKPAIFSEYPERANKIRDKREKRLAKAIQNSGKT